MPQRNYVKDDFTEYLACIAVLIHCSRNNIFIIIGDFWVRVLVKDHEANHVRMGNKCYRLTQP